MLIKGASLEFFIYDRPWYTTPNDVDLVLNIDRVDFGQKNIDALENLRQGLPLEYDFIEHHNVTMNGVLPIDFQMIWRDASKVHLLGTDLYVMSPEDGLISLCVNSCRKRYWRLKTLFDIAESVRRSTDISWRYLIDKAKRYQCANIVYTALSVTNSTLGCPVPKHVLKDLEVNPVRANIIQFLIQRMIAGPLASTNEGTKVLGREINRSLLLPYFSYQWDQLIRKIGFVVKTRDRPMGLLEP